MSFHEDIYTEAKSSNNTLDNLGPLKQMAGIFEGSVGHDIHPVDPRRGTEGSKDRDYYEKYSLQPTDRQTNGPQLFYGLRYHTHIVKIGEIETFHDQVGYWLWEPSANKIYLTLAIPRGQVALYSGSAEAKSKSFLLTAKRGSTTNGICSNPFLEKNFKTTESTIQVIIQENGSWSYNETTTLIMPDRKKPFIHIDYHELKKIAEPDPNPLAESN